LRSLVGEDNFYSDMNASVHQQIRHLINHYQTVQSSATLKQLEAADAVIMIGEDVTQTAPRISLSLRQMSKNAGKEKAAGLGVKYWSAAEVKNITQGLNLLCILLAVTAPVWMILPPVRHSKIPSNKLY